MNNKQAKKGAHKIRWRLVVKGEKEVNVTGLERGKISGQESQCSRCVKKIRQKGKDKSLWG